MKPDHWDDIIRKKMQSFNVDETPKDWDLFEEKLTLSQGEPAQQPEEDFDQMVFQKLNRFEANAGNKAQHWQLFEQQMYYLTNLRQRLLQYKFIEVAALALLLLYVIEADAPGSTPLSAPSTETQSALSNQNILSESVSLPSSNSHNSNEVESIPGTLEPVAYIPAANSEKKNAISSTLPLQPSNSIVSSVSTTKPDLTQLSIPPKNKARWKVLATLPGTSGALARQQPRLFSGVKPASGLSVHISMLGGLDYNRVMTPENLPAGIKSFERYSAGYRGGLVADFGRQESRLRFGGGLIYTAKKYEVGYKRINGSFLRRGGLTTESLSDIEINILNVPVFARWDVWQGNNWSLFAQGGLALQMALQTNYYAAYPDNFPQPLGVNRTPSRLSPLKDRNGGLLEGGNFKENGFFSSQFGLGAERQMAERWSMFFQSRYEYSIGYLSSGLGPTQDRINTFSLETGIRVQLK
ncbi:MAG TPA: outer membrane beta-barrel protein [Saprospiraceae bacterium]|nr:outer membrane beta-barrel protein [Saprospiraceae bacterium]